MRISAGKHLNRRIATKNKVNKNVEYRPTSDRSRQAIFNIILNSPKLPDDIIEGATIIDICCGCGSISLEALSRGAEKAVLIDISREQLDLAKINAEALGEAEKCRFMKASALNIPVLGMIADIIFIDPPYYEDLELDILKSVQKAKILEKDSLIVLETLKNFQNSKIKDFEIVVEREYGKTKLVFLQIK